MVETLVVNPQFELVAVLHHTQGIASNRKVEVKSSLVPGKRQGSGLHLRVALEDSLAILVDLLLSRKHAIVQLDGIVSLIDFELPQEQFLGSAASSGEGLGRTYDLMVLPTSLTSWNIG